MRLLASSTCAHQFFDLPSLHRHVDDVPKPIKQKNVCSACKLGKAHKIPCLGYFEVAERVDTIGHTDTVGKTDTSYPDRYRYASTFLEGDL